ncbi:MAG: DNA polymerase [Anaerovoracaceae bacterium]
MNAQYCDLESNGLLNKLTHMHVAVFEDVKTGVITRFKRGQEKELTTFLASVGTLIMHNGVGFDREALRKLGVVCDNNVIDTLMLSWYLEPDRPRHGLASYGVQFGVLKVEIEDEAWKGIGAFKEAVIAFYEGRAPELAPRLKNFTALDAVQQREVYLGYKKAYEDHLDLMMHRCEEDVKIQKLLWKFQKAKLDEIYGNDRKTLGKFLEYMQLRATILMLKEKNKWKLNVPKAEELLANLTEQSLEKATELKSVMPKLPVYEIKTKPKIYYKKNGEISAAGIKWEALCKSLNIPTTTAEVKYIAEYKEPQPHYVPEVKNWLFSLGWVPETFEFKRDKKTGETRQIPQISIKKDEGKNKKGDICPSIVRMAKTIPELKALLGYTVINHRKGFVQGMLNHVDENGYVVATVQGFTNTMRSKHSSPLANIPSIRAAYGEDIRGLLTCEEDEELCGSDMCSLEDRIKHHFQWDYDPEYVKTQMVKGFDPHIFLALVAQVISQAEMDYFKANKDDKHDKEVLRLGLVRQVYKGGNYSCQYGAGVPTVSRACGVNQKVGGIIHKAYWKLNWSIKAISKNTKVKNAAGLRWQQNPINKFWYLLKTDKDRFSTLAQGSGAYAFDMWIGQMIKIWEEAGEVFPLVGDFHDEVILRFKKGNQELYSGRMKQAIQTVNEELKLNRDLDIDIQFNNTYAGIH